MKQPRKQIYFSKSSIDKELQDFIEKQSNLSKSLTLGIQILYEIFGNIDLKDYIPVGFEAHDTPVTYDKLMKLAKETKGKTSDNLAHNNELDPSVNKPESTNRDAQTTNAAQTSEQLLASLNPETLQALQLLLNPLSNNTQLPGNSPENKDKTSEPIQSFESTTSFPAVSEPAISDTPTVQEDNLGGSTDNKNNNANETENKAWAGLEDFDV